MKCLPPIARLIHWKFCFEVSWELRPTLEISRKSRWTSFKNWFSFLLTHFDFGFHVKICLQKVSWQLEGKKLKSWEKCTKRRRIFWTTKNGLDCRRRAKGGKIYYRHGRPVLTWRRSKAWFTVQTHFWRWKRGSPKKISHDFLAAVWFLALQTLKSLEKNSVSQHESNTYRFYNWSKLDLSDKKLSKLSIKLP